MHSNQTGFTNTIEPLSQAWRIVVLIFNGIAAWLIYNAATDLYIPTGSGAGVWILAATTYWLLTLVAAPFFIPPRDALSTGIAGILLLAPMDLSSVLQFRTGLAILSGVTIGLSLFVVLTALIAIFLQSDRTNRLGHVSYRLSGALGRGEILFTPAVIISAIGFYPLDSLWMPTILGFWTFMTAVKPAELVLRILLYMKGVVGKSRETADFTGTILRIDDPGLIRVTLSKGPSRWQRRIAHIARLPDGKTTYVLPLFTQIQNDEVVGTGLCCPAAPPDATHLATGSVYAVGDDSLATQLGSSFSEESTISEIIGIVVEGSTIAGIKFQVVQGASLEEGMVVFSVVRGKKVYYQILDANTTEESFRQNPYGAHVALASQLGCYDPVRGFEKFPWLPEMNQPLFLASQEALQPQAVQPNEFLIGKVPFTSFGVPVVLDDLIEYHTAVLGITGTGKTELTLDIIVNALGRGAKVFCVDFTGEYKARLAEHKPKPIGMTITQGSKLELLLLAVETGEYGAKQEKRALQAFLDEVKPHVTAQIEGFLNDSGSRLGIFELAEITNTKATLRTTELYLSAIMDWARKNRKSERVLIVLEEAHTIIPESYGSGFDSETQWVVGRIGQIALQGRKYGVGLLVVSQRTALVSKTILSQCNTYFTHSLVDKTSLDYLSSIYSAEHVRAIPNLRFLEFIAYGKGVRSERPLLVRRDFDQKKADASCALDANKGSKSPEAKAKE